MTSRRFEIKGLPVVQPKEVILLLEDIPVTRQGVPRPKPVRPAIPIPSEEESLPEDETIEPTDLDQYFNLPPLPEGVGGSAAIIPPRPIAEVFPEFPERELKKGVRGVVELALKVDERGVVVDVYVIRNTTGSKTCEQAAVQAAYKTRFIPARRGSEHIVVWINKIYKFSAEKT